MISVTEAHSGRAVVTFKVSIKQSKISQIRFSANVGIFQKFTIQVILRTLKFIILSLTSCFVMWHRWLKCLKSHTRWFKYDRDDLCVNKSQFVPVIFEPPCIKKMNNQTQDSLLKIVMMCDEKAKLPISPQKRKSLCTECLQNRVHTSPRTFGLRHNDYSVSVAEKDNRCLLWQLHETHWVHHHSDTTKCNSV